MSISILPRTIHGNFQLPWITLGLVSLAVLINLIVGAAPERLVYFTSNPFAEWYRMFTGHWVHSDVEHATINLGALLILGIMFEPVLKKKLLSVLLLSSFAVSVLTGLFVPEIKAYCGLSGILNSLLVFGCLTLWQQYQQKVYLIFIVLAGAKTLLEVYSQQAIFTHTNWPAVPEAHLIGMLTGAIQFHLNFKNK